MFRVSYSFPCGTWILDPTKFRTRLDAAKHIAKQIGYPRQFRGVLKELTAHKDNYVSSDKTDLRYQMCKHYKGIGKD